MYIEFRVNLKEGLGLPAYHVIVVLFIKNYNDYIIEEEVITIM